MSPDPNDEYFADGLTEELIDKLSQLKELKVIARTSVFAFKNKEKRVVEIGKELGVGSLVEGSVRRTGNRIRVTAQLVDAATEEHLWSSKYDKDLVDIFDVQSDVAEKVADALRVILLADEKKNLERKPTDSLAAYSKYLKARVLLQQRTKAALNQARALLVEARAEDPGFAEAYATEADIVRILGERNIIPMLEALNKSQELLRKVLNHDLAEVHTSLAGVLHSEYKFAEAEDEFKRAIRLKPNHAQAHHWYALLLADQGRFRESLAEMKLAEEADPLSLIIASILPTVYAVVELNEEAAKSIHRLTELDTVGYETEVEKAWVGFLQKDYGGAYEHLARSIEIHRDAEGTVDPLDLAIQIVLLCRMNRRREASEVVNELESIPTDAFARPSTLGVAYLALGNLDVGFRYLEQSYENHSLAFRFLRSLPFEETVLQDSHYAALFKRANLRLDRS